MAEVITAEELQADLLRQIDEMEILPGAAKMLKLKDVDAAIARVEVELVGMRRALVQYGDPAMAVSNGYDENGERETLGIAIGGAVEQLKRLRAYREEVLALPDDPKPERGGEDE